MLISSNISILFEIIYFLKIFKQYKKFGEEIQTIYLIKIKHKNIDVDCEQKYFLSFIDSFRML